MKIGINLVGVSYNDGLNGGRYRNYEDSIDGFTKNIIEPLIQNGHDLFFYLFTYDSIKKDDIIKSYPNIKKYNFAESEYNQLIGAHKISTEFKIQSITYINSLQQLIGEDLDIVISTRFDMCFLKNPFEIYTYDFSKFNFLWREPEYHNLPLLNDTFIVFPHSMVESLIESIIEMEVNPPMGVNIGMHNIYIPLVNRIGKDKIQWLDDRFVGAINDHRTNDFNDLYKVIRGE